MVEASKVWEPLVRSKSNMEEVDCTSHELGLKEHSLIPYYSKVCVDSDILSLGLADFAEFEPDGPLILCWCLVLERRVLVLH